MRKINNTIIILLIISCYVLGIYNLKHQLLVRFLIDISVVPIVFLPKLLLKFKVKIDNKLELIYLIFIFFAYFLGTVLNFYDRICIYDTLMHFLSGIFEAYIAISIYKGKNIIINSIFILGFVSLLSIGWEIFEYTSSIIFNVDPQKVVETGVNDTMKDLIVALFGGLLLFIINKNKRIY